MSRKARSFQHVVSWTLLLGRAALAGEPGGATPAGSWSFLLPLTNPHGCDADGAENMLRSWVAPDDLGAEDPVAGEGWSIDFERAASAGFEAGHLYRGLGLSGEPVWASLEAAPGPGGEPAEGAGVAYRFRRTHRAAAPNATVGVEFPDPDGDGPELRDQPRFFRLARRGWSVAGDATIEGPADGPRVLLRTGSPVGDGEAVMRVEVDDGRCARPLSASAEHRITVTDRPSSWTAYDGNDDGRLDISDPVFHLVFLFGGGRGPSCPEAMDFNGDSRQDISDPVSALSYLFLAGPPPSRGAGCGFFPSCKLHGACP
ncbi:MAG: hypothetical protein HY721_11830 [Planctomycetes bacterium]|nr:hypothetical protein [Planctomycetota bacterium]